MKKGTCSFFIFAELTARSGWQLPESLGCFWDAGSWLWGLRCKVFFRVSEFREWSLRHQDPSDLRGSQIEFASLPFQVAYRYTQIAILYLYVHIHICMYE